MTGRDWEHGEAVLGMFLNGDAIPTPGSHGERITDDSFVLLFNAHDEDREFVLPRKRMGARWELELCTEDTEARRRAHAATSRATGSVIPTTRSRSCDGYSRVRPLRATYRLQLTPAFGFADAERADPVPA